MTTVPEEERNLKHPPDPVNWAACLLILICIVVTWWRLLSHQRPHLIIAPSGLTNPKLSEHEIPWKALERIEELGDGPKSIALWARRGADLPTIRDAPGKVPQPVDGGRVTMTSLEFTVSHRDLLKILQAYHKAHSEA